MIINADIDNYKEITDGLACRVLTYSVDDASADFTAADISYDELGCGEFTVVKSGVPGAHYKLNIVGKHNISNTLASLALASLFEIPAETIQAGLAKYKGTERRFEYKGTFQGATVIDDYCPSSDGDPCYTGFCEKLSAPLALCRIPATYVFAYEKLFG